MPGFCTETPGLLLLLPGNAGILSFFKASRTRRLSSGDNNSERETFARGEIDSTASGRLPEHNLQY